MVPSSVIPPHIAVVDDDRSTRQLLCDLLADESYRVALWSGTDDPVQFVQQTAPDLVILDLHLSGRFEAWDVIHALCGDGSAVQIPVIICSADGTMLRRDAKAFHDHGCVVIEKPFDIDDLLTTIREQAPAPPSVDDASDQATVSSG
jgi:DNA-binding response OmpR family regulator